MSEDDVRDAFETRLAAGNVSVTARDVELLRAIDDHGSIHAAANALERSYAHAQRRVVELEDELGPLVERRRGGSGGGGSTLTDGVRELLRRFGRLDAAFSGLARVEETVLPGRVVERDGELAVVETDAGRVRALVPSDAEAVEVAIRSDAVTLTAPGDAPSPAETSARNRFPGVVESVEAGEAVARIAVDVGAGTPLLALVTRSSLERLELELGREVMASFKATTTRATPRDQDLDTH
jgi:molybdate transport system regulatory protein